MAYAVAVAPTGATESDDGKVTFDGDGNNAYIMCLPQCDNYSYPYILFPNGTVDSVMFFFFCGVET